MARQEEDKAMEGLLRRSLARDASAQACPDAEIFAAYMEHSLSAGETARYELHFSQCARCREQIAAMVRLGEAEAAEKNGAEAGEARRRAWELGWHWLAPAAVVLTIALVWFIRYRVEVRTQSHPWAEGLVAVNKPLANPSAPPPVQVSGPVPTQTPEPELSKTAPAKPAHAESDTAAADSTGGLRAKEEVPRKYAERQAGGEALNGNVSEANRQANRSDEIGATEKFKSIVPQQTSPQNTQKVAVAGRLKSAAPNAGATPEPATLGALTTITPGAVSESVEVTTAAPVVKGAARGAASGSAAATGGAQAREISGSQNTNEITVLDAASVQQQKQLAKLQENDKKAARKVNAGDNIGMAPSAQAQVVIVLIPTPVPAIEWRIAAEGFVEHTQDGGATWQGELIEAGAELRAGSAPAAKICWIAGSNGLIYMTKDSKKWKKISPPGAFDFVNVIATDASDATVTTADGHKYATRNGGKKWQQVE